MAVVATVAGNGTAGYDGDNGVATSAELNGPCGVAADPAGNVLFSDTNNVAGTAVDQNGNLIITDGGNNVIWVAANSTGTFYDRP